MKIIHVLSGEWWGVGHLYNCVVRCIYSFIYLLLLLLLSSSSSLSLLSLSLLLLVVVVVVVVIVEVVVVSILLYHILLLLVGCNLLLLVRFYDVIFASIYHCNKVIIEAYVIPGRIIFLYVTLIRLLPVMDSHIT